MPPCLLATAWTDLAVASFDVDPAVLGPYVPPGLELDRHGDRCYASMVGFMWTRPRLLGCPVPFHGRFAELNLRFYVRRPLGGGYRRGVVFVREIVSRSAVAAVARWAFGENFVRLPMRFDVAQGPAGGAIAYDWYAGRRWNSLAMRTAGEARPLAAGSLDAHLLDQCWAYGRDRAGATVEYQVEHPPWAVWTATTATLDADLRATYGPALGEALSGTPVSTLVATGSSVRVRHGRRLEG